MVVVLKLQSYGAVYHTALDNWHLVYIFLPLIELFLGLNEMYINVPINAKVSYRLPVTTAFPPALLKSANAASSTALILQLCKSTKKNKVNLTSKLLLTPSDHFTQFSKWVKYLLSGPFYNLAINKGIESHLKLCFVHSCICFLFISVPPFLPSHPLLYLPSPD